jgi:hypothetical protein
MVIFMGLALLLLVIRLSFGLGRLTRQEIDLTDEKERPP